MLIPFHILLLEMVTASVSLDVWIQQVPHQPQGWRAYKWPNNAWKNYLSAKIHREPAAGAVSLGEQGRENWRRERQKMALGNSLVQKGLTYPPAEEACSTLAGYQRYKGDKTRLYVSQASITLIINIGQWIMSCPTDIKAANITSLKITQALQIIQKQELSCYWAVSYKGHCDKLLFWNRNFSISAHFWELGTNNGEV